MPLDHNPGYVGGHGNASYKAIIRSDSFHGISWWMCRIRRRTQNAHGGFAFPGAGRNSCLCHSHIGASNTLGIAGGAGTSVPCVENYRRRELPIRTDAENVTGQRVLVGESEATRALGFKGLDFAPQGIPHCLSSRHLDSYRTRLSDTEANRRELGRPMCCGDTLDATRQHIDYWKNSRTSGTEQRRTGTPRCV